MKLIVPVESIVQNKGGVILYDVDQNKIIKQYIHNKEWFRCGWRGGKIYGDYLIATDWSDLHYFNINTWSYEKSFQKSTFNDLHYIEIFKNQMYVVNTGLDAIEIFDEPMNPKFKEIIFLFERVPKLFKKRNINLNEEYNKKAKIKPHSAHPNCVSVNKGGIFVTCFQKDQKINSGEIINLTLGRKCTERNFDCHDGNFYKGRFYTTWTRHSKILEFNKLKNANPDRIIGIGPKGWWRGMVIKNDMAYIFASEGYKKRKITTRLAIVDLTNNKSKIQKLPVVDGIYWDTVYQPNIFSGEL